MRLARSVTCGELAGRSVLCPHCAHSSCRPACPHNRALSHTSHTFCQRSRFVKLVRRVHVEHERQLLSQVVHLTTQQCRRAPGAWAAVRQRGAAVRQSAANAPTHARAHTHAQTHPHSHALTRTHTHAHPLTRTHLCKHSKAAEHRQGRTLGQLPGEAWVRACALGGCMLSRCTALQLRHTPAAP